MLTLNTTVPAGLYGLMPVIDITDELELEDSTSQFIVVIDPISELDGSPDDDSDTPEMVFIDSNYDSINPDHKAVTNRGRTIDLLLLDVVPSCSHPEDAASWPTDQEVSYDTPYGALTVASAYVLAPVSSAQTNPYPEDRGAHNWLVFNLAEETQVIVENGAIVIGDCEIDLIDLGSQPYVGAPE